MAEAEIPVDLLNPGQVFACLGLMEAVEILCGQPCEGVFAYQDTKTATHFRLRVDGETDPIQRVVAFLAKSKAIAVAPMGADLTTSKWGVETQIEHESYPAPVPKTPATLAIMLRTEGHDIRVVYWLGGSHCGCDNVKFWAGAGGYPGAALARDAIAILSPLSQDAVAEIAGDPFSFSAPMSSSFRFDWRRDYVPLDAGFSLNEHGAMTAVGYPLVELLAAIGMQNARPQRPNPRDKLNYCYAVCNAALPTIFARAMLGGASLGFPIRTFRMRLDWPGQEGQARCIVDVREENSAQ